MNKVEIIYKELKKRKILETNVNDILKLNHKKIQSKIDLITKCFESGDSKIADIMKSISTKARSFISKLEKLKDKEKSQQQFQDEIEKYSDKLLVTLEKNLSISTFDAQKIVDIFIKCELEAVAKEAEFIGKKSK